MWLQGAAADSEAKSEELSRAVEELQKLLKEAGEGAGLLPDSENECFVGLYADRAVCLFFLF